MFQKANKVTENGLIAFQGMCVGLGDKIDLTEIGRYLKAALQSQEDDCAKSACGIISDLSNSMGEGLNEYLDDFVPCLHDILKSNQIDRKIKLPAIHALGSLSLNSGDYFNLTYLNDTMVIINMAAEMATSRISDFADDLDTLEFLKELRDEILEQYSTILITVEDSENAILKQNFSRNIGVMCEFIKQTLFIDGYKNLK